MDTNDDTFKAYLVDLLSACKTQPVNANDTSPVSFSIPPYQGRKDTRTEEIVSGIEDLVQRMWAAEAKLREAEKNDSGKEPQEITRNRDDRGERKKAPRALPTSNRTKSSKTADQGVETLKPQIRDVVRVCKAIAEGDFTQKITIDVLDDDMLQLKEGVNAMVETLSYFSREIIRVTHDIIDGNLGTDFIACYSDGSWLQITTGINTMSSTLKSQIRSIAIVIKALLLGDLSKCSEVHAAGEALQLKNTVNQLVIQQRRLVSEITRVTTHTGCEGMLGGQADVPNLQGVWSDTVTNVNIMALNFTNCVRSVAEVVKALAHGDFSARIQIESQGEVLELKETVNGLAKFLDVYTDEVGRVVREVGGNGRMGGQGWVRYAGGKWKVVMDDMNEMMNKITLVIRCIAVVTTAVARGDLTQKITGVDVSGELLMLLTTINDMVEELEDFTRSVKKTAGDVGVDGNKALRGTVGGVIGVWRELRACVDETAGNY